jgi:DNA-binding transcriptional LysR family regulator
MTAFSVDWKRRWNAAPGRRRRPSARLSFQRGRRELKVRVEGQFVFNPSGMILNTALAGLGLAYLLENLVEARRR